jgi:hypothetical protein
MSSTTQHDLPWEPTPTTGKVRPDDIYYLITDPPSNGIGIWRSRARPTPDTTTTPADVDDSNAQ